MTLNTVTLKWDLTDLIEAGLSATLAITPTAQLSDTTDHILIPAVTRSVTFSGGQGQLAGIVANDNSSILPANSGYLISVTSQSGKTLVAQFQTQLLFSNGAIQWLDQLATVPVVATSYQYLPLPTGTPSAGQVPVATGTGEASAWGSAGGSTVTFTTESSSFTMSSSFQLYLVNAASSLTATLPNPAAVTGVTFTVKRTDSTTSTVEILPHASELIDGASTAWLANSIAEITLVSDGTNWWTL